MRYLERTAFTRKEDPYALKNDAFCHDTSHLPVHCTCIAGLAELFPAILHWVEAAVSMQKNVACTSKENKWIMPTPKEIILYLKLREINFKAPKRLKLKLSSPCGFISSSVSECNIVPPSEYERDDFYMRLPKRGK